jgi:site-specific DNA-methyltransferase (adenine-specific)
MGTLYFGDNLNILREHIKDESVDLIYLDPPFNSKRAYNLLFKTPEGHVSDAQITAFEDTWHWGDQAEREFAELLHQPNTDVAETMQALRRFLGENDVMAYLTMMANRLVELRRVLKSTGSLYLHCDPTASHYLKIVLDMIFGAENFINEIVWERFNFHADAKRWGRLHDTLLVFAKDASSFTFQTQRRAYDESYINSHFKKDEQGRLYTLDNPVGQGQGPARVFFGKSLEPSPGTHWRFSQEKIDSLIAENRIVMTKTGRPRIKRYLDEMPGQAIGDVWTDVPEINSQAAERLGYPTQKPLALLERIINASSNPGDLVLDPFCGCGTAVHAAQKLGRDWIGIDITHLAISLIEKRLKSAFPSITFEVFGTPKDFDGAKELAERNKYEFQWWACALVNAQPYKGKKKGADTGIDGIIYFQDDKGEAKKIIVSVKSGENVTRTMIADLKNTVEREKAQMGLFVTLAPPTKPMIVEAASAGFYESPAHGAFPKIQILSIEGLLSGKETPLYPDLSRGSLTFKKAKTETENTKQSDLL